MSMRHSVNWFQTLKRQLLLEVDCPILYGNHAPDRAMYA